MTIRALATGILISAFAFSASAAPETDLAEPELPLSDQEAWAMLIDQDAQTATHDLTGFVCPFGLPGDYALKSVAQYRLGGEDVSCSYSHSGRRAFISYYLSFYGNPVGSKEQAEGVVASLKTVKNIGDELVNKPTEPTLGDTKISCHYIEHLEKTDLDDRKTAVRTCSIGAWVYKTRFTWYEGEDFADADLAFQNQQSAMGQTLSACTQVALPTEDAIVGDTTNVIALSFLMTLASDDLTITDADGDDEAAEALLRPDPEENAIQCVLDVPTTDTYAYTLMAPAKTPVGKISYTKSDIYEREEKPTLWVSGFSLGALVFEETTYAAWTTDNENAEHMIETYTTLPTAGQMRQLLSKLLSGDVKSLASYKRDADGNSTLSINSDTLDEDTAEEIVED